MILDGKKINFEIASELRGAISALEPKGSPNLLIIMVGENEASLIYIQKKIEFGYNVGAQMTLKNFPESAKQEDIINYIKEKNNDPDINGILVQLPLPKNLNRRAILDAVSIEKDIDGISSENLSRLNTDKLHYIPVPVKGVLTLLEKNNISFENKKVAIINDSNLIGKPAEKIISQMNAKVFLCNEETENLKEITREADILITAIGKPEIIDESFLKKGQVVVDIGISQTSDGVKGDVKSELIDEDGKEFELQARTPVPGGVGPMTVASLFQNLLQAYKNQKQMQQD